MKKYVCDVCGYVYDPAVGDPDGGIAPGTAFEDIEDDWVCPICGVGKDDFSPVEEQNITESSPHVNGTCPRGGIFYVKRPLLKKI